MSPVELPACPTLLSAHAYENVCRCECSTDDQKSEFLTKIALCTTEDEARRAHEEFCGFAMPRTCRPTSLLPDEGLGVFVPADVFKQRVAESNDWPYFKLKAQFDLWLDYELKRSRGVAPLQTEIEAARAFRKCQAPIRPNGTTWLFRHPNRARNAFDELANEWLGARLGLDVKRGEARLTFGFLAGAVDGNEEAVRRPTFLDSNWSSLKMWHWNGRTLPLPGTPSAYFGLEEVVAPPPYLRDLYGPVLQVIITAP